MSEEMVQGARIARGTALMTVDRFYSAQNSREPRTEHWMLSITYYLNPKQVSDQARIYPQYEFINPLGLTVTEFHENRVSVDPLNKHGNNHGSGTMSYELILPFFPEELRELLLDPSISDLMINGTTGVFADRNGMVEHIELRNAVYKRAACRRPLSAWRAFLARTLQARIRFSIRACRMARAWPWSARLHRSMARR